MKITFSLIGIITLILISSSCFYNNLPELQTDCGADSTINYTKDVKPILEFYECLKCHGEIEPDEDIYLHDYASVKKVAIEWDILLQVMDHTSGYEPMPPNAAKMDSCSIDIVKTWIQLGAPEN